MVGNQYGGQKPEEELMDDHLRQKKLLNARAKIIEALIMNMELKKALKNRIKQDAVRASMVVAKALRRFRMMRQVKRNKRMGIFPATVYLENMPNDHDKIRKNQHVEVFGEFTSNPWGQKIKCVFDDKFQCFKADI
jgi:hypothetical protein